MRKDAGCKIIVYRESGVCLKLVELGMFRSYDNSSSSFDYDEISGNELILSSSFPRQMELLMETTRWG